MSFNLEEFYDILEAFKTGNWEELRELVNNSDPESVIAAEKYFGTKFSTFIPTRIGVGQGKMKEYTKSHSKKFYSKKICQAKTLGEKQFWKAIKSSALTQKRKIKAQKKLVRERVRKKEQQIKKIVNLKRQHKTLLQSASRSKIPLPYKQRKIGGRKGAYKRLSTHIKNLERENKLLKLSLSKNKNQTRIAKTKTKKK